MTIAAYVRVSSKRQKDDSQRAEIQKWMDANGIDPKQVEWYADKDKQVEWYADKETGTKMERPEFQRLQADIFRGKVKCVILWKLDRLSRRLKDGVTTLADWAERGLKIVVVTQQLEFNGAVGRTLAALLMGLSEIEWEYRKERQQAGIAVAKKKGVYKGRKPGTTKSKPQRAKELRDKGLNPVEIATALGVSERTVFRYLDKEAA
jgi:DNA invertase Pin-like site-specific DNA recombinase